MPRPYLSRLFCAATLAALWVCWAVAPAAAQLETRSQLWTNLVPFSVVTADFNHDGNADIAVASLGTERTVPAAVQIYLGRGDGTFDLPVPYDVGLLAGNVGILYGIGNGAFRSAVLYPAGEFPWAVAIADFNGDGKEDITVTDRDGDQQTVLLNTGVVSFSPTTRLYFKKQRVGTTSTPQTVTLTNTGMAELKIQSIKPSAGFATTSTCGATVAPGANCTITATFSPIKLGSDLGTISIIDNASSKPQVIELFGTGD